MKTAFSPQTNYRTVTKWQFYRKRWYTVYSRQWTCIDSYRI